jgi:hypothetical protein
MPGGWGNWVVVMGGTPRSGLPRWTRPWMPSENPKPGTPSRSPPEPMHPSRGDGGDDDRVSAPGGAVPGSRPEGEVDRPRLETDLVTQGDSAEHALAMMADALHAVTTYQAIRRRPLLQLRPAPREVWDLAADAVPLDVTARE